MYRKRVVEMWTIRLVDGKLGIIYMRDALLDGEIIYFEKEEMALRFMQRVRAKVESALDVKLRIVRYDGDPRKEKLYKVSVSNIEGLADYICAFC